MPSRNINTSTTDEQSAAITIEDSVSREFLSHGIEEQHLLILAETASPESEVSGIAVRASESIHSLMDEAAQIQRTANRRAFFRWFLIGSISLNMKTVFIRVHRPAIAIRNHAAWKRRSVGVGYTARSIQYAEEIADAGIGILEYAHWGLKNALEMKWPLKDFRNAERVDMTDVVDALEEFRSSPELEALRNRVEETPEDARLIADTVGTYLMLKKQELRLTHSTFSDAERIADQMKKTPTKSQIIRLSAMLDDESEPETRYEHFQTWVSNGAVIPSGRNVQFRPTRVYEYVSKIRAWYRRVDTNNLETVHRLRSVHEDQLEDLEEAIAILCTLRDALNGIEAEERAA